eukprot:gene23140-biopygen7258
MLPKSVPSSSRARFPPRNDVPQFHKTCLQFRSRTRFFGPWPGPGAWGGHRARSTLQTAGGGASRVWSEHSRGAGQGRGGKARSYRPPLLGGRPSCSLTDHHFWGSQIHLYLAALPPAVCKVRAALAQLRVPTQLLAPRWRHKGGHLNSTRPTRTNDMVILVVHKIKGTNVTAVRRRGRRAAAVRGYFCTPPPYWGQGAAPHLSSSQPFHTLPCASRSSVRFHMMP